MKINLTKSPASVQADSLPLRVAPMQPVRYDIVDTRTGAVVGSAKTRARANQSADKRDMVYGAVRFCVKSIYA